MDIIDDLAKASLFRETALTIGAFDGVHRGHQSLIRGLVERARETTRLSALVTFHPHPVAVVAPDRAPRTLTTPAQKVTLIKGLGVDLMALLRFDHSLATTPAREFVAQLVRHLHAKELWVGPDFALGRGRDGNIPHLEALGQELGFELRVIDRVLDTALEPPSPAALSEEEEREWLGTEISSSRIRRMLSTGYVWGAARLLGRYHTVTGEVECSTVRWRSMGHCAATLRVGAGRALPAEGIYAIIAQLGSCRYPGVAILKSASGLPGRRQSVEAHILDLERDISGCDFDVEFVARLSDARTGADADGLETQIEGELEAARLAIDDLQPDLAASNPGNLRGRAAPCAFRIQELGHTADRALKLWAGSLGGLFAAAATGMCRLMAGTEGLAPTSWRQIRLEAPDLETLMVEWLNELLFLSEVEQLLFLEFRMEVQAGPALVGQVGATPGEITGSYIKAATFHDLSLVREHGGWSTVITFDV